MKDCYAVHLINWFNLLPEKDTRSVLVRAWHKLNKIEYWHREKFFAFNESNLARNVIDNRHAWTKEELGL